MIGRPSESDRAAWAEMVDWCERAANDRPSLPWPSLARALDATRRLDAPGLVSRDNACIQLAKTARRFMNDRTSASERVPLQARMLELIPRARALLVAPAAGGGRERRDIDG